MKEKKKEKKICHWRMDIIVAHKRESAKRRGRKGGEHKGGTA